MVLDFPDSVSLLKRAQEEGLYEKLLQQLHKDFGLVNVPIAISLAASPEEIRTLLHEKIYYLILERLDQYLNLLYVIDVPEKVFKQLEVTDAVEVAEQITFLVLKRELQKVLLRTNYGG